MTELASRIQRAISELTGNEALLGMLETEAASEMLNWGINLSKIIIREAEGLEDIPTDVSLLPRLKAVRSSMRAIGNWAAGKYVETEDRIRLRDTLLDNFKVIGGESAPLPSVDALDHLLNQVDDKSNTPHQLVVKATQLLANQNQGDS